MWTYLVIIYLRVMLLFHTINSRKQCDKKQLMFCNNTQELHVDKKPFSDIFSDPYCTFRHRRFARPPTRPIDWSHFIPATKPSHPSSSSTAATAAVVLIQQNSLQSINCLLLPYKGAKSFFTQCVYVFLFGALKVENSIAVCWRGNEFLT